MVLNLRLKWKRNSFDESDSNDLLKMFKIDRDETFDVIKKHIYDNLDKNPLFDNLDLHEK